MFPPVHDSYQDDILLSPPTSDVNIIDPYSSYNRVIVCRVHRKLLNSLTHIPQSPYFDTAEDDLTMDENTNNDNWKRMITRDVTKKFENNKNDVEYYNKWILSNMGRRK